MLAAMSDGRTVFQVELRVRDLSRAVSFYKTVFDWRIYKAADDYALVDTGAMPVVSLLQTANPKFPIGAVVNLLVENCDQEAARAVALGARISVPKSEVPNSGTYVGIVDPWGSELYFWQPVNDARPHLQGTGTNPISFVEIGTPDLPAAIKFYSELAGWSFWNVVFKDAFAMAEGCGLKRGVGLFDAGAGAPGLMTNYVEVTNLDETAQKIVASGGTLLVPPSDFPGEGRFVLFADPDGIRLGAIQAPEN
jgi:predicted enzyme related to lactoylglutathione lyase